MNDPTEMADDAAARELMHQFPEPAAGAPARVRARLQRSLATPPRSSVRPLALAAGGVLAAAAAYLLAPVVFGGDDAAPRVEGAIASETGWSSGQLPKVDLTYRGVGEVAGPDSAPRIAWQRGTIHVEVQPDQGIDLRVQTREAEVRVVGTGFSVTRDALGTHVEVRHGRVETTCTGGAPVVLGLGETRDCLPQSAAGLLGRAHALADQGAVHGRVLEAVNLGLSAAGSDDPARDELLALKVDVLAGAGLDADALEAARELVTRGSGIRRQEVLASAPRIALRLGPCSASAPWLLDFPGAAAACGDGSP